VAEPPAGSGQVQPFLVRLAGERQASKELRNVKDGALCYMPRAMLTEVRLVSRGQIAFSDIASPGGDDPHHL
jgi:hypothetical protein